MPQSRTAGLTGNSAAPTIRFARFSTSPHAKFSGHGPAKNAKAAIEGAANDPGGH